MQQHARVAMVGMVVKRPRAEHDVRFPFANQADDLLAHFERRQQLAVVVVEPGGDAQDTGGALHLGLAPLGQRFAGFTPVTNVAVGDGDEFHMVAGRRPQRCRAAGFDLAVVGVRSEADDAELAVRPSFRLRIRSIHGDNGSPGQDAAFGRGRSHGARQANGWFAPTLKNHSGPDAQTVTQHGRQEKRAAEHGDLQFPDATRRSCA